MSFSSRLKSSLNILTGVQSPSLTYYFFKMRIRDKVTVECSQHRIFVFETQCVIKANTDVFQDIEDHCLNNKPQFFIFLNGPSTILKYLAFYKICLK